MTLEPPSKTRSVAVGPAATLLYPDPDEDGHWDELAEWLAPETPAKAIGPLRAVLNVARQHGCRAIVLEHRYLDLDYRSEYTGFWSKRFEGRNRVAQRLHFFRTHVDPEDLHDLPDRLKGSYVGYSVLRPTLLGPVGRTVLAPPPELAGAQLCQVRDRPSLFGSVLEVTGVPFCQQDGEVLICAHTAAWMCHYVAQDRRIIGRRTTAEIVSMPSAEASRHRPVPSNGLTGEQLQGIFSNLGIPAFFYDFRDLPELPVDPPGPGDVAEEGAVQEHQHRVAREQVLRVVCKYLNSGFPVVVLTENGSAHAYTLVGWRLENDEIRLLACDDQVGPYEEITDPFADTPTHRGRPKSLMVPLPEKVFLTGEAAETNALGLVELLASQYAKLDDPEVVDPQANDLSEIHAQLSTWRGPISIRARLLEGRRYKALLGHQQRSPAVLRTLRLSHLPHWVWLVEFHDRTAREAGEPCVLAEIVYDSTSHDDLPVADLVATTSVAVDVGLERLTPGSGDAIAEGDGLPWRSMISDLAQEEPSVGTSSADADAQHRAA